MATNIDAQEIAIIGTSCRFPGNSTSPSKLWELLRDPRQVSSPVPSLKGHYHQNGAHHGHTNVKTAYLLPENGYKTRFDAAFFGVSPTESNAMDPQIRLALETVYEALETGGQRMDILRGSNTAVYVGQMVSDYDILMNRDLDSIAKYHVTGTSRTMMSSRISYFFDWHGPSLTIDTACSSSLTALHQAVQQLRSGQSDVAVVAAANLIFDMSAFVAMSKFQMLSPDGQSRMWDATANGYARGEGVAALVLKTRRAAEVGGDDIECIIRETALNQDGKTTGITMPSASAQAQLIRDCYSRAGLDLSNPTHRPQFFEAHGTGTPAGDPVEAEAISSAFFSGDNAKQDELLVGSIKTVIGHTEATAGLAGLLKALLAIRHATIPPNMLFKSLNPNVAPFYNHLRIATSALPWPALPDGVPRRASVNSFGFGGANAHAILESYEPPTTKVLEQHNKPPAVLTPFAFSAASEASLKLYLERFAQHMRGQGHDMDKSLRDIAYTMFARRTELPVTTTVSAQSTHELVHQLEEKLNAMQTNPRNHVSVRARKDNRPKAWKPRVLGVFTGQGAQWPQMGIDLIMVSPTLQNTIEKLQSQLNKLSMTGSPTWSLLEELRRDAASSHVMHAETSQPLCTVIQILQVDLLKAAGVELHTVVGHSSGEIAAAYAAGYISAEDAVCIAYYRGLFARLAQGDGGKNGAMMAVATTLEDAEDLLGYPEFEGRVCVAAVNSANSVTLSGDFDAVKELLVIFQDENKFARMLKVDKAYHSRHMIAASARYLDALATLNIRVGSGTGPLWFSSVTGLQVISDHSDHLRGVYWDQNLKGRVSFMQAVDAACRHVGYFDLTIEIGPHPALQGPVLETLQPQHAKPLPYVGLFRRGASAITSVAECLGVAWAHLGGGVVDLKRYDTYVSGMGSRFKVFKDIPSYAWNHGDAYWHESRLARAMRLRPGPGHELLGHLTPDSTQRDVRWRNILGVSEIPWLSDHKLQNVVVFPATGYIVSVFEAALAISLDLAVEQIVLSNIEIHSALVFERDDTKVEVLLSLADIKRNGTESIEALFKYHATSGRDTLELKCSGHVLIHLGEPSPTSLPCRPPRRSNLKRIDQKHIYEMLSRLDYGYSGQFATLNSIDRKMGIASGFVDILETTSLLIHPGVLDAAFQAVFMSHAAPDDAEYSEIHVPRYLSKITINPSVCALARDQQTRLAVDAIQSIPFPYPRPGMICDIDIYPEDGHNAMIQTQGLECVRISKATAADDVALFSNILWGVAEPDAQLLHLEVNPRLTKLEQLCEKAADVILKRLQEIYAQQPTRVDHYFQQPFRYSCATKSTPDTVESISEEGVSYTETNDVERILGLGDELTKSLTANKTAVASPVVTVLGGDWFSQSSIITSYTQNLAQIAKQLVYRNPHMNIIEVATRADISRTTTKTVIGTIGSKFSTYTVVDADVTSFELKREPSKMLHENGVIFKQLDISSIYSGEQDSVNELYDLMIVSVGVCTAPDLRITLQNMRGLVRPGGYLSILLPSADSAFGVLFNAYPNWWLDGGSAPSVTEPKFTPTPWANLLQETGFSGIDSTSACDAFNAPFSVIVSQAMDSRITILRNPLTPLAYELAQEVKFQNLIILNGKGDMAKNISYQVFDAVGPYFNTVNIVSSVTDLSANNLLDNNTTVLSLADIDSVSNNQVT